MSPMSKTTFAAKAVSMSREQWIAAALAAKGLGDDETWRRDVGETAWCAAQAGNPMPLLQVARMLREMGA